MLTALLAALTLRAPDDVELYRQFTAGQTYTYDVKSHLLSEFKSAGMGYFLPADFDINYKFTMKVEEARQNGFATVLYERPTMDMIEGETAEKPPKTTVEKTGMRLRLTLSPVNELTDVKDLSEKKDKKDKDGGLFLYGSGRETPQDNLVARMVGELQRMAMFIGNLDSALDFSPKLPLDAVKPGDTWKKTVSYQPRELKGTNRQAMQRLDYTFVYDGLKDVDGKKVHQVTGNLELDTDAAKFMNQIMETKPEESGLKELRLKMKTKLTFLLDEATKATRSIVGESEGGFSIEATGYDEGPIYEEKLKGKTTMKLVSLK
ncbi:MAG: hypothetical protein JSS66_00515 [Armatimonadetes bacterium]|nr:hypothetical protein [Armatimonadota bacterium]